MLLVNVIKVMASVARESGVRVLRPERNKIKTSHLFHEPFQLVHIRVWSFRERSRGIPLISSSLIDVDWCQCPFPNLTV